MDSPESPPPSSRNSMRCSSLKVSSSTWRRSVKRKLKEIDDEIPYLLAASLSFNHSSIARIEIENECAALRETVTRQQLSIQELYNDLDEERNASSSAANEAMSMILRLQREKAEVQMESRQFKRFAEEKMAHDQHEILVLEDLLYKREQSIRSLSCEVQAYKHRMLSLGFTEADVEEVQIQNMVDNCVDEIQFELPSFDYPPLKCNIYENPQDRMDLNNGVADGETSSAREQLQNLEDRIYQLENSEIDKVVVGQSPRGSRHARRFSTDSAGSFFGMGRETSQDCRIDHPRPSSSSFKKTENFSHTVDYSNLRKGDNASELGDDMSDRVYTIDSVHHGLPNNGTTELKAVANGICEDSVTSPRESLNRTDTGDSDIKNLYMRLQALEAERESMKHAIMSMRADKAQLILLKEIAQNLCKDMTPERRIPVKKPSPNGSFSIMSAVKWIVSFIFRGKKSRQTKYMFGLSDNNVGLLMLLDKGGRIRQWRCLTRVQV